MKHKILLAFLLLALLPVTRAENGIKARQLYARNPDDCDPVWQNIPAQDPAEDIQIRSTSIAVIEYKTD